ncbi:MAG TPA: M23 family metallopeptidase [Balneolales bacterium]|nr:M23 family metallopeptidase [Balneolales bacterium]
MMILFGLISTVIVPLILISWQAFSPEKNFMTWFLKSVANISVFTVLYHIANWAFVSYYLRYIYFILFVVALIYSIHRIFRLPLIEIPNGKNWIPIIISLLMIFLAIPVLFQINKGKSIPANPVNLQFPLNNGNYYIAQGGSHIILNGHMKVRNSSGHQWRGQTWALDILELNNWGNRSMGLHPKQLTQYAIFGDSVLAPCNGNIVEVQNDLPDHQPPNRDTVNMSGNYVIIQKNNHTFVLLAHLKKNSIVVNTGDRIHKNDFIGRIGNSGNSSEPHLHINAQQSRGDKTILDAEPLPILFNNQFLSRNDVISTLD